MIRKDFPVELTIARVLDCEFESIDNEATPCKAVASHAVRELGLFVCGAHADSVHKIALALKAEREAIAQAEAEADATLKEEVKEDEQPAGPPSVLGENPAGAPDQSPIS